MRRPPIIPRRAAIIALWLLVLLVLIAGVANVPWALSCMRSRTTITRVPMAQLEGAAMPLEWPIETPHRTPWPPPDYWFEGGVFGCRVYDVRNLGSRPGRNDGFQISAQHLGWPYPVIVHKQMWWNWNDPALSGAESDPAPSLMLKGLVLNPLIVGGGAWMVLVLPWIAALALIRFRRYRRNRCMACGYPIGTSDVCTECGSDLARP